MEHNNEVGEDLHKAASQGRKEVVAELLLKDVDIDHTSNLGWTPLMCAARNGHLDVVLQLINCGANIHHTNKLGTSVLSMAAASGNKEVLKILLKNLQEREDSSFCDLLVHPFFVAILYGHLSVLNLFLEEHQDLINISDKYGISSLMVAAAGDQLDVLEFLLGYGADTSKTNICFNTALDIASVRKHKEIEKRLKIVKKEKDTEIDMCSLTYSDSIGFDLIENYGWSCNKSFFNIQIAQKSQGKSSQMYCNLSPSTSIISSSFPFWNSDFVYPPKENAPCNTQNSFPSKSENVYRTPIHVPVPPVSPYGNASAFKFPNKDCFEECASLNKRSCNTPVDPKILSPKCGSKHITLKQKLFYQSDTSSFVSSEKKNKKTFSLSKKQKMKLWWNQSTTERFKNFFSMKQKSNFRSENQKITALDQLSSDNLCLEQGNDYNFAPETSYENASLKMPVPSFQVASSIPTLLANFNLDIYIPMFVEHEIDMDSFIMLDERDLQEMGIICAQSREKLLTIIASLKKDI